MITMIERMLTLEPELDGVGVGLIGSDLSPSIKSNISDAIDLFLNQTLYCREELFPLIR